MRRFSRLRTLAITSNRPSGVLPTCKPLQVMECWVPGSSNTKFAVFSKLYFVVFTGGNAPVSCCVLQPVSSSVITEIAATGRNIFFIGSRLSVAVANKQNGVARRGHRQIDRLREIRDRPIRVVEKIHGERVRARRKFHRREAE